MASKIARTEYLRVRVSKREIEALEALAAGQSSRRGVLVTVSDVAREALESAVRRGLRMARETRAATSS